MKTEKAKEFLREWFNHQNLSHENVSPEGLYEVLYCVLELLEKEE